jgi:hypothetical protein
VKDDWRARLPEEKAEVFSCYARELESYYGMLSVSLDEALDLQQRGQLRNAFQAVNFTPQLCVRLTASLASLIRVLGQHAKHYGTIPNAAPLDPENFLHSKSQRAARMSGILGKILFSQRTQFLHKLGTLQEMVEDLGKEFCTSAQELGEGLATDPILLWRVVDTAHYDLNTCLRETIVLLKSFLFALPDDQLAGFQKSVAAAWTSAAQESRPSRPQRLGHGRMAHITGE